MGTLQNQSPNSYPNRSILPHSNPIPNLNRSILPHSNPTPNTNPNPNPNTNANPAPGLTSPSFEEVSKLFSLPLSDTADSLGICPSDIKKVCYDNGLVRWPYRKFLSGKSIEEIKKDAAVKKEKQLAELKIAGVREVQPIKDNKLQSSHMNKMNSPVSDEFKYGFPSDGLSSIAYRWWGNKSADENVVDSKEGGIEDDDESDQQPKDLEDIITNANLSSMDVEVTQGNKYEAYADSLSALRRKMAKDGQQALKLGVYSVKTFDRAKKCVLLQIFKSSLPSEWGDMSSGS